MADDFGAAQVIGNVDVGGFMNNIVQGIWIIVILAAIGLIIFFVIRKMQYKYPTIIKDVTGSQPLVYITKSREYWTKEGIRNWQNEKFKENMGIPPSSAFDVTNRGQKLITAYRIAPKEYIFETPENIIEKKDKKNIDYFIEKGEFLNMSQRAVLVDQQMKANDHLNKGLASFVKDAVPYLALIIIIGMVVFGWGELVSPFADAQNRVIAYTTAQNEQLQIIKDIKLGVQRIGSGYTVPEIPLPPG